MGSEVLWLKEHDCWVIPGKFARRTFLHFFRASKLGDGIKLELEFRVDEQKLHPTW